jgi:hypothetical protein
MGSAARSPCRQLDFMLHWAQPRNEKLLRVSSDNSQGQLDGEEGRVMRAQGR